MKRIGFSLLLGILLAAVLVAPVLAGYYATLTVTEANGNAYTQIGLIETVDVDYLADNGYISSTGLDTRVLSAGTAIPHLMVDDSILFSTSLAAYETNNLQFTTDNTALTDFYVITGDGGYVTVSDHANLELSDDFEIEFDGWVDVTAAAYATVAATATSEDWDTSHTVDLPSGVASGDLLIVCFGAYENDVNARTLTFPGGWTELVNEDDTTAVSGVAYRVADGGEGSSITVTTSRDMSSAHNVYRITGYQGVPEAVITTPAGVSGLPNPPSLTASWGTLSRTLWIAGFGGGLTARYTLTSPPTNYGDELYRADDNAEGEYGHTGSARREYMIDTEDPGVFTLSGSIRWFAWTIAVQASGTTLLNKDATFNIIADGTGELSANILGATSRSVTATGLTSGEYIVNVWADTTDFGIDIDGSTEDSTALSGASVTDNANDLILYPVYWDYYNHTTSSTLRIDYDPDSIIVGTTLPNEDNPGTYDGAITWGSNPAGVTVTLGGLVSDEQLFPAGGGADFPEPQDIAGPSGQPGMTSDVGTLTTNPLYPIVSTISDTTSLPVGVVWVMGATFILALLFVWMIGDQNMMHQMFIGLAGGGWVAFCWHLGIYPFWVIFIYAVLAIAIVIGERSPTIS